MKDKLYDIKTVYLKDPRCRIVITEYAIKKRPAIRIETEDGLPLITATVNIVEERCDAGCTFIKNYSENRGILSELIRHGIVEETGRVVTAGHESADEVRIIFRQ